MPTIRNILNIQGSKAQVAALLDFISDQQYGQGSIDFNQVTPMLPWVYRQPTNLALLEKYGKGNCARGWCLANWGTPQNAIHPEKSAREYDGGTSIHFDTEDREVREAEEKKPLPRKVRVHQVKPQAVPEKKFISYALLYQRFGGISPEDYQVVFDDQLDTDDLNRLYEVFNAPVLPQGYTGHRLSVSDVVELYDDSASEFWFLDEEGFVPVMM